MSREQRAAQLWSILALAAMNRQVLSYGLVAQMIGVPTAALGQLLEPIQAYCLEHSLPGLTSIVVSDESGLPGSGFTAASDLPREQMRVFRERWTERQPPTPAELTDALRKQRGC